MKKNVYTAYCPNILVESPVMLPSVKVGVLDILERFQKRGLCTVFFMKTFEITKKDILLCDILITVRGCESMSLEIAQAAKKMGRFLIYYLDDDLLNLPKTAISSEFYSRESNRSNLINLIKLSDILWSNNDKIINKYYKYGNNIRCVRNDIIAKTSISHNRESEGKTKLLYAGSVDHSFLVRKYVLPAINRIISEYKDSVEVTFIGIDLENDDFSRIKTYEFIDDYDKYKEIVNNGNYDIGLAAISTSEFFQCKYYNKFIEYTSIGAVGVYTNSFPYKSIVKSGVNGILVENSVDNWYEGIKFLIEHSYKRTQCLESAQKEIEEHFNEDYILNYIKKQIPEFISYKVNDKNVYRTVHLCNGRSVYVKQRLNDYWRKNKLLFVPNVLAAGFKKLKKKSRG